MGSPEAAEEDKGHDWAQWRSLPQELRVKIAWLLLPVFSNSDLRHLADAARLSLASRGCFDVVEEAARQRYEELWRDRWRSGGGAAWAGSDDDEEATEDVKEEEEEEEEEWATLPAGARSWVRLLARRLGLLPPDVGLSTDGLSEDDAVAREDQECLGTLAGFVTSTGGRGGGISIIGSFVDLGLRPSLMRGFYYFGIKRPSPLQSCALGPIVAMRDVLVQAPSGTGRSTAYAIGVLQNVDLRIRSCQALVLVPWSGKSIDMMHYMKRLGSDMGITSIGLGYYPKSDDDDALRKGGGGAQVVVGTPGRVRDFVRGRSLSLRYVRWLVLDDPEEALSAGFQDEIYDIYRALPSTVSVGIFTGAPRFSYPVTASSLPAGLLQLASNLLPRDPVRVRLCRPELTLDWVRQFYVMVKNEEKDEDKAGKVDALCRLVETLPVTAQAVVYCETDFGTECEWLSEALRGRNVGCSWLNTNKDDPAGTEELERIVRDFRGSASRLLITDDYTAKRPRRDAIRLVAPLVVNFDVPDEESYLYRIGRRGHGGGRRVAVTLVTSNDIRNYRNLERFYKTVIEKMPASISDFL